jgi:hypothetical protein
LKRGGLREKRMEPKTRRGGSFASQTRTYKNLNFSASPCGGGYEVGFAEGAHTIGSKGSKLPWALLYVLAGREGLTLTDYLHSSTQNRKGGKDHGYSTLARSSRNGGTNTIGAKNWRGGLHGKDISKDNEKIFPSVIFAF